MPKTILRTFRVNPDDWQQFQQICDSGGRTASSELFAFIKFRINGGTLPDLDLLAQVRSLADRIDRLESRLGDS